MTAHDAEVPPTRDPENERLAVFLGVWQSEGISDGGTDQAGDNPRANDVLWTSTHTGRWHRGEFFLIQDEQAQPSREVFDTLRIMGVDPATGGYFAAASGSHGFYLHYDVIVYLGVDPDTEVAPQCHQDRAWDQTSGDRRVGRTGGGCRLQPTGRWAYPSWGRPGSSQATPTGPSRLGSRKTDISHDGEQRCGAKPRDPASMTLGRVV